MKTRVAAYARVSTTKSNQKHSFEFQSEYWRSTLSKNPNYYFVGLFADKGISGKYANKRPQFMSMLNEAKNGKIDLIFCKSVQRFSRNTEELLTYVRELREYGVGVIFEKENINTLKSDSDLMLTIAVAVAEDDLSRYSQNIKWAVQDKYEKGEGNLGGSFYGYNIGKNQSLTINPKEAEVVRRIYSLYKSGMATQKIANLLTEEGIVSPKGKDHWNDTQIKTIISSVRYKGDLILHKFYSEKGKKYKNNGERDMYYVENHHEGIISKEEWEEVYKLHEERGNHKLRGRETTIYPFTSLITCGCCGSIYKHCVCNSGLKNEAGYYRCRKPKRTGEGCEGTPIKESVINNLFVDVYNEFIIKKYKGTEEKEISDELDMYFKESQEINRLYINGWLSIDDFEKENKKINTKIDDASARLSNITSRNITDNDMTLIDSFDESKVAKFISKVICYRYEIEFYFYNGVSIKREYMNCKPNDTRRSFRK